MSMIMSFTMGVSLQMGGIVDLTPITGHYARHVLKLNRSVVNPEGAQDAVDLLQNAVACGRGHVLDQYMRTERMRAGA